MPATQNGTGHDEPSTLDGIVEALTRELEEAQEKASIARAHATNAEETVAKLRAAVLALAGPPPKKAPNPAKKGKIKKAARETVARVEAAIVNYDGPATVTDIAALITDKDQTLIRQVIYELRDADRIRIADMLGNRKSARYLPMPDVIAEHTS
jgi:hypothetical protein